MYMCTCVHVCEYMCTCMYMYTHVCIINYVSEYMYMYILSEYMCVVHVYVHCE